MPSHRWTRRLSLSLRLWLGLGLGLGWGLGWGPGSARAGDALDEIRARGVVRCLAAREVPGIGAADAEGRRHGFEAEFCRALAAALFGDPGRTLFVDAPFAQRFSMMQQDHADVLLRMTSYTLLRNRAYGLEPVAVALYDGQGFLVRQDLGVQRVADLKGATICVQSGTTTISNLREWFQARGLTFSGIEFGEGEAGLRAFFAGRCDALTGDATRLAAIRKQASNPEQYLILPERISKEPIGPYVRQGSGRWADIVRWTLYAMIEAEERGIGQSNVTAVYQTATDPAIRRLLGQTPELGAALGLDPRWAYWVIMQVGNYGEMYQRTIGAELDLPRGLNRLWTEGGLIYAWPLR